MRMNRVIRLGIGLGLAMRVAVCLGQASPPPESQRQTALALEQQGKNVEAEAAWRAFLKAHPSNPEPYAHLGLLEARQEHYKEAVPLYRKALAMNPAIPGLRLNLGLALFKGGELKQAIQEFKPLLKNQPPGSDQAQRLTILIGMAHYGLGEYAAAAPYLKQAADNDAQNLPLRLALAHSCLWAKQYQCVLDTYHEILNVNAESAEADMLAGEALDEKKDTTGAIQQFRAAVKANPKEPDAHYGLGYLLWIQKQYPEAASEFQAELDNNPNHVQALTYLGDTQMHLKHPDLARPLLENALRLDAGQALAHLDLGILLADAGSQEDALREMRAAAKLDPEDVNVHWRLGRLYRTMGRNDEAKAEFDKASSINKATDAALVDKINNGHNGQTATHHQVAAPEEK
jgi:tetratricopeptide (TPR) repeat protein